MTTERRKGQPRDAIDLSRLQKRQDDALGLTSRRLISDFQGAAEFLASVGVALRYGPTRGLPLASLYRTFAGREPNRTALSRGIALTNQLLGEARAIEVYVIADRVTLVHRSLVPALYALVRRKRELDNLEGLSVHARTAMDLFHQRKEVTAGELRHRLGLPFDPKRDPAYAALGELARLLLVDRGPFKMPASGIPYLSREGYPHHLFHEAHADLVRAAARFSVATAAEVFLGAYLRAAVFARVRKLTTLFKAFLSADEIESALQALANEERGKVDLGRVGRDSVALYTGRAA